MKPNIYSQDKHQISLADIDPQATYVIQKLRSAGHLAYLVGGGVRDLLLKQKPKDFDISTSARPEEVKALFRNSILIGRRFRLAHVRFGRKVIEVSTFRAGDNEASGLIVRDNVWGTEEQDVLRRDFTINGLYYDPENQTVIDYVNGFEDVEKRLLRTIGEAKVRFQQDPVRMLRLIKFCARFQFEICPEAHEALLSCRKEIIKSSQARILEELFRMLESGASQPFIHLLYQYGLLQLLLPPLSRSLSDDGGSFLIVLLSEVDAEIRKGEILSRELLLSTLLFPLCNRTLIQLEKKKKDRPLHLGQIMSEVSRLIDATFSPFFHIPRKFHSAAVSIIAAQYRILSLRDEPPRSVRPPRDPLFPLALHLFKFRATILPSLWPHYQAWTEASFNANHRTPRRKESVS